MVGWWDGGNSRLSSLLRAPYGANNHQLAHLEQFCHFMKETFGVILPFYEGKKIFYVVYV